MGMRRAKSTNNATAQKVAGGFTGNECDGERAW